MSLYFSVWVHAGHDPDNAAGRPAAAWLQSSMVLQTALHHVNSMVLLTPGGVQLAKSEKTSENASARK